MDVSPLTCTSEQLFTILNSSRTPHLRLCLANPAMTVQHVILLLRNAHITQDMLESICENQEWISQHTVQFAVVNCPKTPHTLAMRVLQLLFWRDLVKTAGNLRISPRLRRAAENHLRDKLLELSMGEKITIARTGPRSVIAFLREETAPRVISALLQNPHTIEDDVLRLINDEFTEPEILSAIGKEYKWSASYPVRLALVRNERTPLPLSLSFLSKLRKQDLLVIINAPATPELIRRAAERIVKGEY